MTFRTPSSILIVGPSGCCKTVFVTKLLKDYNLYFPRGIPNIHYCYGVWQDGYETLRKMGIQLHEGIPSKDDLVEMFDETEGGQLVLDDLMREGGNDKRVLDLFTKDSHHRNINSHVFNPRYVSAR